MTALEKQIQASEKRLAKYEKNVGMYRDRADKKLSMLQNNGFMVTRNDFTITKNGRWKYDYDYTVSDRVKQMLDFVQWNPVIDNMLQERENADRLADEQKVLDELKQKQQEKSLDNDKQKGIDLPLVQKLTEAFAPFREEWKRQMLEWHAKFYVRIHEQLPNAKKQYSLLEDEIYKLMRENGFRPTPKIKQLESARASFGRIISAPPVAFPTRDEYLEKVKMNLEKEFGDNITVLATKCRKFELDADKLQIHHPTMSQRGFDVILSDGKDRVVDARMIWAAEYSEYVAMHTRYIVTERAIKHNVENNLKDTEEDRIENTNSQEQRTGNPDTEQLFLDALTDIAMYVGWKHLEFEDSKERTLTLQGWAREFTKTHAATDWENEDYIDLVDKFAGEKVNKWLKLHPVQPSYKERITDINIYSGRDGGKYIRCRIDGEQQMGVKMSFADTVNFGDNTDRMALAARYFKETLQEGERHDRGMKR